MHEARHHGQRGQTCRLYLAQPRVDAGLFHPHPEIGRRFFCARCHIFCFGKGHLEILGGDFVSVNLNCVDGFDVSQATLVHWDGRHNNWSAGPRPTPWPIDAAQQ